MFEFLAIVLALSLETFLSAAIELEAAQRSPWNLFGVSLATAADIDGDDVRELVIGDPGYRKWFSNQPVGQVAVVSPVTGQVFWRVIGDNPGVPLGSAVTVPGDLDGDGSADVVTSSQGGGRSFVSAFTSTGDALYTLPVPHSKAYPAAPSLCSIDDIDGDGVRDVVIGLAGDSVAGEHSGSVWWVSGANGTVLRDLPPVWWTPQIARCARMSRCRDGSDESSRLMRRRTRFGWSEKSGTSRGSRETST